MRAITSGEASVAVVAVVGACVLAAETEERAEGCDIAGQSRSA
jgi:hypothetical protein